MEQAHINVHIMVRNIWDCTEWGPLLYCSTSYIYKLFLFVCNSMRAFSGTLHTLLDSPLWLHNIFLFYSRCKIGIKDSLHRLFSYEFLNSSPLYISSKDFLVWHKKKRKNFFMILFMNYCVHTLDVLLYKVQFISIIGEIMWRGLSLSLSLYRWLSS